MTFLAMCDDPVGSWWQLGSLPDTRGLAFMVGWGRDPGDLDSGVPAAVAAVVAHALTSVGWVSFPVSPGEISQSTLRNQFQTTVTVLDTHGPMRTAKAWLMRRPLSMTVVSTRDDTVAIRAFDQSDFPWALQAQFMLLSAVPIDPSRIDYKAWSALLDGDWKQIVGPLASVDVQGFIRPGVDGDVAAVVALTREFFDRLHTAFERETQAAGLTFTLLSEAEFANALARD